MFDDDDWEPTSPTSPISKGFSFSQPDLKRRKLDDSAPLPLLINNEVTIESLVDFTWKNEELLKSAKRLAELEKSWVDERFGIDFISNIEIMSSNLKEELKTRIERIPKAFVIKEIVENIIGFLYRKDICMEEFNQYCYMTTINSTFYNVMTQNLKTIYPTTPSQIDFFKKKIKLTFPNLEFISIDLDVLKLFRDSSLKFPNLKDLTFEKGQYSYYDDNTFIHFVVNCNVPRKVNIKSFDIKGKTVIAKIRKLGLKLINEADYHMYWGIDEKKHIKLIKGEKPTKVKKSIPKKPKVEKKSIYPSIPITLQLIEKFLS
jgi:hypothetical protein